MQRWLDRGREEQRQRHNGGATDGTADRRQSVGGASVDTPTDASTARRAHGLGAWPRRTGSAPPVTLAKQEP